LPKRRLRVSIDIEGHTSHEFLLAANWHSQYRRKMQACCTKSLEGHFNSFGCFKARPALRREVTVFWITKVEESLFVCLPTTADDAFTLAPTVTSGCRWYETHGIAGESSNGIRRFSNVNVHTQVPTRYAGFVRDLDNGPV